MTTHELTGADAQAMQAVRAALAAAPKLAFEPGARESYDQIIGQAPPPKHVRFEQAEVGGVPGWFAKQAEASGLTVEVHIWQGVIHVFPSNFAMLQASASALADIARFLAAHLGTRAEARA